MGSGGILRWKEHSDLREMMDAVCHFSIIWGVFNQENAKTYPSFSVAVDRELLKL